MNNLTLLLRTVLVIMVLGSAACNQNAPESVNTAPVNEPAASPGAPASQAPSPTPSPSPLASPATAETDFQVTLPLLDAMFADDTFVADLKSRLQLTDDEINRLRAAARAETARLRQSNADQRPGTAAEARERALDQIRSIIGDEKTARLVALVRDHESAGATTPVAGAQPPAGAAATPAPQAGATPTVTANALPTDTRIVVNIPAYRMDAFDNGRLVKSYRIGIGYPEFPLPSGMRKATTIIYNPTWTPPDEPWVESSNKVEAGERIPAGDKLNPLGVLKIPIGSPSLIHGGKQPSKIGGFASHGCVGLTDSQAEEFAKILARLGGAEITDREVADYSRRRDITHEVKLSHPVPVELRYETIVVEDGKLHIYRDVYDRGTNTIEKLKEVLAAYDVTLDQLSPQERDQAIHAIREMALDPSGKPVSADERKRRRASAGRDVSPKVTRAVKGRKEIVIDLPELHGKGYPAPVDLNTGTPVKTRQPATTTRQQRG